MALTSAWRRRLLITGTLYLTFLGGTILTDLSYWPRVAHHAIVTVGLLLWMVFLLRNRRALPATALDAPLLAFFLANVLATIFAADPRISLEYLWRLGVHTMFFYAIVALMAGGYRRDVLEALFFVSSIVILIGLVEFVSWYFGLSFLSTFRQGWPAVGGLSDPLPPNIYRLTFTLNVSTGLSAYLAALIPFGLSFALTARKDDTRRAFWLWLVGALIVEGLSFSRGGVLSLAASLPTFAFLAFYSDTNRSQRAKRLLRDWRVVTVGLTLLLFVTIIALASTQQSSSGHRSGDMVRLDMWRSALQTFQQNPLTGVGPYGFGRALREARSPLLARDNISTANNTILQVMAESGILGLAALLWIVGRFLWIGYHRWRAADGARQLQFAAACAGVLGFAVHSIVDTFVVTPFLLPMLVMAAFVTHQQREDGSAHTKSPVGLANVFRPALLLVLISISALGWVVSDWAQYHYSRSQRLARHGQLSNALAEIEQARAIDPGLGLYAFQRAYLVGQLADDDPSHLDEAIAAYRDALVLDDTYDLHRANYAALLSESGDLPAASDQMAAAMSIQPAQMRYPLWLGGYAESLHDFEQAADWYEAALRQQPSWAASAYWQATDWRQQFLAAQVDLAEEQGQALLLLYASDPSAALTVARQKVEEHPEDIHAQATLGEVALRAADFETALTALDEAIALQPTLARLYALQAEALLASGDLPAAELAARTAIFIDPFGDGRRANFVLAQMAEQSGDLIAAEEGYIIAGPVLVLSQNWEVAVYGRRASFDYLPQLQAPGPTAYDFDPWQALIRLYRRQGRTQDVQAVIGVIRLHDPFYQE